MTWPTPVVMVAGLMAVRSGPGAGRPALPEPGVPLEGQLGQEVSAVHTEPARLEELPDEPEDHQRKPKRKVRSRKDKGVENPLRGRRYAVLGDGEGDVCIRSLTADGSLLAIPNAPRFRSKEEAERWVNASGDLLAGFQCILFRAMEIFYVEVVNNPTVIMHRKPKVLVRVADEDDE